MRVASTGLAYWVARFFLLGTKARILGLTHVEIKSIDNEIAHRDSEVKRGFLSSSFFNMWKHSSIFI